MTVTQPETEETYESWDTFWQEVSPTRTETIRGVEVRIPSDLPLDVMTRIEALRNSSREEDLAELVSLLFGPDVFGKWKAAGMGFVEFQTVFTWGISHASGAPVSFSKALQLVREHMAGKLQAQAGGAS